jgi:hypothetical protein
VFFLEQLQLRKLAKRISYSGDSDRILDRFGFEEDD